MKKILFAIVAIFVFTSHAHAQQNSCIVKDGNGASITITVEQIHNDGKVDLSVSSDCNDYVSVNYTLSYRIYYQGSHNQILQYDETSQPFNVLAQPLSNTPKTVTINLKPKGEFIRWEIRKVNISGAKCQ